MNFCHPAFQPDIECDKACVDGHEVTNLVSGRSGNSSAFLTESFIKPPVNVTVRFPCNVDLARIVLNSAHGAQRSCGFDIYSYCGKRRSSWLLDDVPMTRADKDECKIFSPIGKGIAEDASVFCFVNGRYRERHQIGPRMSSRLQSSSTFSEFALANRYPKHTSSVSELTIRITRVAGSGVCAIRWLEIWGQPSYCCSPEVVTKVEMIKAGLVTPPPVTEFTQSVSSHERTEEKIATGIPPEFIDPITQELMSVPVLLPSGNSVDQSTADRYIQEEAKWGRAPSDLFTGVVFSAAHKPVPNAGLKMRIDKFLLSGMADGVHVTRRRLGGDRGSTGWAASRLVDSGRQHVNGSETAERNSEFRTIYDRVAKTDDVVSTGHISTVLMSDNVEQHGHRSALSQDVACIKVGSDSDSHVDVPRIKRARQSPSKRVDRNSATIDLTLDDNERTGHGVRSASSDKRSGENALHVRKRKGSQKQREKGPKRTCIYVDSSSDDESFAAIAVTKHMVPGTAIARDGANKSRHDKVKNARPRSNTFAADRPETSVMHTVAHSHLSTMSRQIIHHSQTGANKLGDRIKAGNRSTEVRQVASHEHAVDSSLETALTSALRGLPTFSRGAHCATDSAKGTVSCRCGVDVKDSPMYRLECRHVICRRCLLHSSSNSCSVVCAICHRETTSSGIVKIH